MQKHILLTEPELWEYQPELEEAVEGALHECVITQANWREMSDPSELSGVHAVIGHMKPRLLKEAKELEWMQATFAGVDSIVKPGILGPDVILTNASGAYGLAVSEYMLAMTYALIRHFGPYRVQQYKHEWKRIEPITSVEGSVVLVLGVGDIGGDYARKCKALGAYTIGVRRTGKEKPDYLDEQYTLDHLDELLPRADIVAMVLPGGEETTHVLDERRLHLMKKGAYLVNAGRGSAIDEVALARVMEEGYLAGAGLDVFETEPLPEDSPLWDMENVFITPHAGGNYSLPETMDRIIRICKENLTAYANDKPFSRTVDRGAGY